MNRRENGVQRREKETREGSLNPRHGDEISKGKRAKMPSGKGEHCEKS